MEPIMDLLLTRELYLLLIVQKTKMSFTNILNKVNIKR